MPNQIWSPQTYHEHAAFVPALGAGVVDLLAPAPGERILDLGCGEGTLTRELVDRSAIVVGVDASATFVAAARARGLDARLIDAEALPFDREFDAVFSNAAIHWMRDIDAVVAGVHRALRDGGRFVGEFGGHGNVAAIAVAIRAVLGRHAAEIRSPWYFPTDDEFRAVLEAHGFVVDQVSLFPRPTTLPTDIIGWLHTFAQPMLEAIPASARAGAEQEIADLLRPSLCDRRGVWTADYVRLRFAAHRNSEL